MLRHIPDATPVHDLHESSFRSTLEALAEAWDPGQVWDRREPGDLTLYDYAMGLIDGLAEAGLQ